MSCKLCRGALTLENDAASPAYLEQLTEALYGLSSGSVFVSVDTGEIQHHKESIIIVEMWLENVVDRKGVILRVGREGIGGEEAQHRAPSDASRSQH